ncbi:MAG: hypothetical protein ACP5N3_00665 [Candidatus Nanoarchaeia archaeon]
MTHNHVISTKQFVITLLILVGFTALLLAYQNKISLELGILISIITFVYGFFLNSVFSFIHKKFSDFRINMAELSGNIQSLYNMACLANQPKFEEAMRKELILFVESYQKLSPVQYEKHQMHIDKLFEVMKLYKINNKTQEILYTRMINTLNNISSNREKTEILGDRYLVGEIKVIFVALTSLVGVTILMLSLHSIYFVVLSIILELSLTFMAFLLFNMDRVSYGKIKIRRSNLAHLLELIKK